MHRRLAAGAALLTLALLLDASTAAAGGTFKVSLDPPPGQIQAQGNPDSTKTPTTISVQALGPDGRAVRDARIEATLVAPDPPTVIGSDVPRAEGRTLVRTSFGAPDGRQSFSTVLPIRGEYRLDLRASPASGGSAAFTPFSQVTSFNVHERPGELRDLVLVLLALTLFGAISAAVMARPHMRRRAARQDAGAGRMLRTPGVAGAAAILGLLLVVYLGSLILDGIRESQHDRQAASFQGPATGLDRAASSDNVRLRYHVDRSSEDGISVQTLVGTQGSLLDRQTAKPVAGGELRIEVLDRETGKPAFMMQEPAAEGRFRWAFDYWDGVEYDTTVAAVPAGGGPRFAPVADTVAMEVQPLSPPLAAKFVGLSYLLLPVLIGMILGVLFARRRWGTGRPARPARRSLLARPATR